MRGKPLSEVKAELQAAGKSADEVESLAPHKVRARRALRRPARVEPRRAPQPGLHAAAPALIPLPSLTSPPSTHPVHLTPSTSGL